jgi:hypothetical protein
MKPKTKSKTILTLIWIAIISFYVFLIASFVTMMIGLNYAVVILGVSAVIVSMVSFSIALVLGIPEDGKGIFSSFRDDGL